MDKIVFPSDGGQICLDLVLNQDYVCPDKEGTLVCHYFCNDGSSDCDNLSVSSSFTPSEGFSESDVTLDENGCLHCNVINEGDDPIDMGEFCFQAEMNDISVTQCFEVDIEGGETPVYSNYTLKFENEDGSVCSSLVFDKDGGTQCFKWYVYATATYSDGREVDDVDVTSLMDGYNFIGTNDYFSVQRDPDDSLNGICVTAQANETENSRSVCAGISIFSPTTLYDCVSVTQHGDVECTYSDYTLTFTKEDGTACTSLTFEADGGTECLEWHVYATETCSDGTVTTNVDVTSTMSELELRVMGEGFTLQVDSANPQNGICITAEKNETSESREDNACITLFSPSYVEGCVGVTQSSIVITYSEPEVYIEYRTVPNTGTVQMTDDERLPIYSYVQYKYENGVVVDTITEGGTLLFRTDRSILFTLDSETGMIPFDAIPAYDGEEPLEFCYVSLNVTLNGMTGTGQCCIIQEEGDDYKIGYHLMVKWSYDNLAGVVENTRYAQDPIANGQEGWNYYQIVEEGGQRVTYPIKSGTTVADFVENGGQIIYNISNIDDLVTCQLDGVRIDDHTAASGTTALVEFFTHESTSNTGQMIFTIYNKGAFETTEISVCDITVSVTMGEVSLNRFYSKNFTVSWWI